jgi:hypothetical protein
MILSRKAPGRFPYFAKVWENVSGRISPVTRNARTSASEDALKAVKGVLWRLGLSSGCLCVKTPDATPFSVSLHHEDSEPLNSDARGPVIIV